MTTDAPEKEEVRVGEAGVAGTPAPRRSRRLRTRTHRRPVRRFMIVTHRWTSLLLGLVLLLITTSGALLLYRPELAHVLNAAAYSPSGGPATVSFSRAFETVKEAHPDFAPTGVVAESGILKVHNADYEDFWTVDPSTGAILGHVEKTPTAIAWLDNLHECFLSCEGMPGFVSALNAEVPGTGWLGFDGSAVTYGSLVLGIFGLLLLYLSLTGLWLWFPRPRRWRSSMTVRWKRGRFARDTDLHKVAGMVAIPLLLVWAITGAGFELEPVQKAWYALTPGSPVPERPDPVSVESKQPDIGIDAAVAAAQRVSPGDPVVSVDLPAADDPTGVYYIWLSAGFDPYGRMEYPGDRGVVVERHTAAATVVYGSSGESTAQVIWDSFNFPVHTGYIVNGWWRLIWLAFALSPLLLAITGLSTWLIRHRTSRNRKRAASRPAPDPVRSD